MIITLAFESEDDSAETRYHLPYTGAYEVDLIRFYDDVLAKVVTALVENKRQELEADWQE